MGSPNTFPPSCERAAFFNESIIRDIITGRNLKSAIGHFNKRVLMKRTTYTEVPLIVGTKWIIRTSTSVEANYDLRAGEKLKSSLEIRI